EVPQRVAIIDVGLPRDLRGGGRGEEAVLVVVQNVAEVHHEIRRRRRDVTTDGGQDRLVALVVERQIRTDVRVRDERERERLSRWTLRDRAVRVQDLAARLRAVG